MLKRALLMENESVVSVIKALIYLVEVLGRRHRYFRALSITNFRVLNSRMNPTLSWSLILELVQELLIIAGLVGVEWPLVQCRRLNVRISLLLLHAKEILPLLFCTTSTKNISRGFLFEHHSWRLVRRWASHGLTMMLAHSITLSRTDLLPNDLINEFLIL